MSSLRSSSALFGRAFAAVALLALLASAADAQSAAPGSLLHLPMNHFEFTATGDTVALVKPLRIHNGSSVTFTGVRVTRIVYADSSRGASWLVPMSRQSEAAPDELATVGALCVNPTGLLAGTYRATAAVAAREAEAVPITVTLVVKESAGRAARPIAACAASEKK